MKGKKGKRVLVKPEGSPKAKKWLRCPKDIPTLEVGEVSLRAIEVLVGEVARTIGEAMGMADDIANTTREALEVLGECAKFASKVAAVVEVGCGTTVTID